MERVRFLRRSKNRGLFWSAVFGTYSGWCGGCYQDLIYQGLEKLGLPPELQEVIVNMVLPTIPVIYKPPKTVQLDTYTYPAVARHQNAKYVLFGPQDIDFFMQEKDAMYWNESWFKPRSTLQTLAKWMVAFPVVALFSALHNVVRSSLFKIFWRTSRFPNGPNKGGRYHSWGPNEGGLYIELYGARSLKCDIYRFNKNNRFSLLKKMYDWARSFFKPIDTKGNGYHVATVMESECFSIAALHKQQLCWIRRKRGKYFFNWIDEKNKIQQEVIPGDNIIRCAFDADDHILVEQDNKLFFYPMASFTKKKIGEEFDVASDMALDYEKVLGADCAAHLIDVSCTGQLVLYDGRTSYLYTGNGGIRALNNDQTYFMPFDSLLLCPDRSSPVKTGPLQVLCNKYTLEENKQYINIFYDNKYQRLMLESKILAQAHPLDFKNACKLLQLFNEPSTFSNKVDKYHFLIAMKREYGTNYLKILYYRTKKDIKKIITNFPSLPPGMEFEFSISSKGLEKLVHNTLIFPNSSERTELQQAYTKKFGT
jgi:hypothetical protein